MASNAIVSRVQDFLKQYPPFSYLNPSELKPIATSVHVQYYGKGKFLFQENDLPHSFIFVLQKGRIEIAKRIGDSTQLIDICDEGDVFGIRADLNNLPYIGSAIASEDSLVYAIPNATFLQLLEANASVALFFASGLAAGMPVVREGTTNQENRASDLQIFGQEQVPKFMTQEDILIVKPTEEVITCDQSASIASAAQLMKTHRIGSVIIVDADRHPIGIVTDTDFTRKVVAKHIDSTLPISSIMSSPVFTI
ncbi:MAG: cyclic nucleotide-binding domain-containing protein, partial [Bacteroidota bacterium]